MWDRRGWIRITCRERDEHMSIMGEHATPLSSLTDLDGIYGTPIVYTEWGRDDQDEPILRDYRWPPEDGSNSGPDARPCEHWFYVG